MAGAELLLLGLTDGPAATRPPGRRLAEIACVSLVVFMVAIGLIGRLAGAHARMAQMAFTDQLTGLPNRNGLAEFLAGERARTDQRRLFALHIDLDHFKRINDTLGHQAGDHVLQVAAARMLERLRREDFLARVGGDEFCAVLVGLDHPEDAKRVARRIIEALDSPIDYLGNSCRIGASIGIAAGPKGAHPVTARVLMDADLAAYEAKAAGRGQVATFDERMRAELTRDRDVAERLAAAVESGAVVPHFQPVLSADGRRVLSLEVLAHWHDPDYGVIPPPLFLRIADQNNLVALLSDRIRRDSFLAFAGWRARAIAPACLSINLTANELKRERAAERLLASLHEANLGPRDLAVEVRESVCSERAHEIALASLSALSAAGVEIILDDFGEDQASLANLSRLQARTVKLDRKIVGRIGTAEDSMPLVTGLVGLARSMGIAVIAKGVESRSQIARLEGLACDGIQGEALARPMPADSFGEWLSLNAPHEPARA